MRPDITAVVVHHSGTDALRRCLASLAAQDCPAVLVDVSPDGEAKAAADDAGCVYLPAFENRGYGWACNLGAGAAATSAVLVSNSDVVFTPGAVGALAAATRHGGVVAPVQLDPVSLTPTQDNLLPLPGRREALSRWLHLARRASSVQRRQAVADLARCQAPQRVRGWALSGACLALGQDTLEELRGFDTDFFLYEEDVDLCLRARRTGIPLLVAPDALVLHASGTNARGLSLAAVQTARASQLLLWRKHRLPVAWLRAVQLAGLLLRALGSSGRGDAAAAGVWLRALLSSPRAAS